MPHKCNHFLTATAGEPSEGVMVAIACQTGVDFSNDTALFAGVLLSLSGAGSLPTLCECAVLHLFVLWGWSLSTRCECAILRLFVLWDWPLPTRCECALLRLFVPWGWPLPTRCECTAGQRQRTVVVKFLETGRFACSLYLLPDIFFSSLQIYPQVHNFLHSS